MLQPTKNFSNDFIPNYGIMMSVIFLLSRWKCHAMCLYFLILFYFHRPGIVDRPVEGTTTANAETITLPEIFHDFETAVADLK